MWIKKEFNSMKSNFRKDKWTAIGLKNHILKNTEKFLIKRMLPYE